MSSSENVAYEYSYNTISTMSQVVKDTDGKLFKSSIVYDSKNKPIRKTYPGGFEVQYIYNDNSELIAMKRVDTDECIWHFQFGGGKLLVINSSSIDFSGTSQRELGLDKIKIGETMDPVNLFNMGMSDPAALAFGRVEMTRVSDTQFKIANNGFDFTPVYDTSTSLGRNAGNIVGAAANYNLWLGLGSVLIPLIFWGSYDVSFSGYVTIPK